MKLHAPSPWMALLVAALQPAAMAQSGPSPVGTWMSSTMMNRDWNVPAAVELTISAVEAERARGRFVLYFPSGGGFPNYCRNGPVTGRFDGTALHMVSETSNLCSERKFDLKLDGDRMIGTYRGANGVDNEVTFTRQR